MSATPDPAATPAGFETEARRLLDALVPEACLRARGAPSRLALANRFIDDPDTAHAIFRAPELFEKRYVFLETLARGRFSANGEAWKRRAALTQPTYARTAAALGDAELEAVYRRQLSRVAAEGAELFQVYVDAGTEVISRGFGLERPLPWPAGPVARLREDVALLQALTFMSQPAPVVNAIEQRVRTAAAEVRALWREQPEARGLLARLAEGAEGLPGFEPEEELLQNLLAASDTTASALMWAMARLAHHPETQDWLDPADPALAEQRREAFIKELLRLYPPVPLVTRVCTRPTRLGELEFAEGEVVFVSLIGLHTHPAHWREPLAFWPERPEFGEASPPPKAYVPFLAGPRVCGGRKLAQAELRAALRAFLSLYRLKAIDRPPSLRFGLSSRPAVRSFDVLPRAGGASADPPAPAGPAPAALCPRARA